MRICSASLTSSRERSVNLRDAPMCELKSAAQIMRTIAVGGRHSLVLQFCTFAAVVTIPTVNAGQPGANRAMREVSRSRCLIP
jgi:hypothetical protein